MALRLLEHEVKDVRAALADLPTLASTREVTGEDLDGEEHTIDVDVAEFDAYSIDQHRIVALMERLGEIYDVARAREIRASMLAGATR